MEPSYFYEHLRGDDLNKSSLESRIEEFYEQYNKIIENSTETILQNFKDTNNIGRDKKILLKQSC